MQQNTSACPSCRRQAFTLIESSAMLVALTIFTLLVAGITKPYWGDTKLTRISDDDIEVSDYIINDTSASVPGSLTPTPSVPATVPPTAPSAAPKQ